MAALAKAIEAQTHRRILTLDIERLPGLARVWDQRTRFIPVSQWTQLPSLLSVSAKWYGTRTVEFYAAWDDPEAMLEATWQLINSADILIGFNSKRFDLPHLQGAWLQAGMAPPSPSKHIDLFQIARSSFGFESKSLAHLCQRLGIEGKNWHYDPLVAEAAMAGDERAQRRVRTYNSNDVRITERAYDRLLPWIGTHPHVKVTGTDVIVCPRCGSDKFERLDKPYLAVVMEYSAYRCQSCAGIFRAGLVRRVARTRSVR